MKTKTFKLFLAAILLLFIAPISASAQRKVQKGRNHEYVVLTPEDVSVSPIEYNHGRVNRYIKSIKDEGEFTIVTFINSIHFDSNWTRYSSESYIVDTDSDKRYYPVKLEKNIPMDSLLVIKNHAHTMVEFDLYFPKFDKKAKNLLYCSQPSKKIALPTNAAKRENILIRLDEYRERKKGVIIREALGNRYIICSSKGYQLYPMSFDVIEKVRRRGKTTYKCIDGKREMTFSSKGEILDR